MDWLSANAPTIVEAFNGGQSAGTGLASVLLGEVSPSAVLPWTVYPDNFTEQVKMSDMAMRAGPGHTYRFFQGHPTFPFFHGLSYTQFELAWHSTPPSHLSMKLLQQSSFTVS